jgi:hypothetical protein
MDQHQPDCAQRAALYSTLAVKARQRAEFAEQAHDFDLADMHTKLATGYAAIAHDAQALSRLSRRRVAI